MQNNGTGKLKCCLNFEIESYLDNLKHFPKQKQILKTKKGEAKQIKIIILIFNYFFFLFLGWKYVPSPSLKILKLDNIFWTLRKWPLLAPVPAKSIFVLCESLLPKQKVSFQVRNYIRKRQTFLGCCFFSPKTDPVDLNGKEQFTPIQKLNFFCTAIYFHWETFTNFLQATFFFIMLATFTNFCGCIIFSLSL